MISPFDTQIPVLPTTHLTALQLFVDRDGKIAPDAQGHIGRILNGRAAIMSANTVWVMQNGSAAQCEVFQAFLRYNDDVVFSNPSRIYNWQSVDIEDVKLVVTGFNAGALGAQRAGDHAHRNVKAEIERWRRLAVMSDSALAFALETNIGTVKDLTRHEANCNELVAFSRSQHPSAQEIRKFLRRMSDPRDIRNRHNVWRMVLMVRAVQRRAQELADGKHDSLAALQFRNQDVEMWVGVVVQRTSRMASELEDQQSWWFEIETALPKGVSRKRIANFVTRLEGYIEELRRAYVKPFGYWAAQAVQAMIEMVLGFRSQRYEHIVPAARKAVAALRVIALREQVSLAISMAQEQDGPRVLRQLQEAATAWRNTYDRFLDRHTGTVMSRLVFALDRIEPDHLCIIADALRDIERQFDTLES